MPLMVLASGILEIVIIDSKGLVHEKIGEVLLINNDPIFIIGPGIRFDDRLSVADVFWARIRYPLSAAPGLFQIIKETTAGVRRTPGTKVANPLGEIICTPPEGVTVIRDLLTNLERFIYNGSDVDALINLVVMLYQFEAIYPFTGDNGRTQ
jgi:hypothetical protein